MEIFAWLGGAALVAASVLLVFWLLKHPGRKMDETSKKNPAYIALWVLVVSSVVFLFTYVFTR